MPIGDLGFIGAVPVSKGALRNFVEKQYYVPPNGSAGSTVETVLDKMLKGTGAGYDPVQIIQIEVIPAAAITVNSGNYVTLNILDRGPAGAGDTVIASLALNTGEYPAFVPFELTLNGAAAGPNLNDVLTFQVVPTGSGQDLPQLAIRMRISA